MMGSFFAKPPDITNLSMGEAGEEWVAYLYRKKGFKVIDRNFELYSRKKIGELDLVCKKGQDLVVVEVKTRRDERFMSAEESVGFKKQNYLRTMTKLYVDRHPEYSGYNLQIDVAAVIIDPVDKKVKSVRILENVIEDN